MNIEVRGTTCVLYDYYDGMGVVCCIGGPVEWAEQERNSRAGDQNKSKSCLLTTLS